MTTPIVVRHALVEHHLSILRDKHTPSRVFRATVRRLAVVLACEATRDLRTCARQVQTPLATTPGARISDAIAIVPILRAGLAMVEPVVDLLPDAQVRHLGAFRDETSLQPVGYYNKLPGDRAVDVALVVDPMLATGGSAVWAIDALKRWGVGRVGLLSLIAAPQGVRLITERHPDVTIHVCAVDDRLDDRGFIVPGLGDAGDRAFNTASM